MPHPLLPRLGLLALLSACASADLAPPPTADSTAGAYLRGRVAANQRAYAEAADSFLLAAHRSGSPLVAERAFAYALTDGRVAEAVRYAERGVGEASPDHRSAGFAGFESQDLPRLTLAVDALRGGDAAEAQRLLEGPYGSGLGRSAAFLLEGWTLFASEGPQAGIKHLSEAPDGQRNAYTALHLALMFDLAGDSAEATRGYAVTTRLASAQLGAAGLAGLKEREGAEAEARALYEAMARETGYVSRIGRMGLARLGAPLEGESEAFVRLSEHAPVRLAETPREGAALALVNIAWSLFESAIEQQRRFAEQGFEGFEPSYDVPLAFAQLAIHLDGDADAARYLVGEIAGANRQPKAVLAALAPVSPSSFFYDYAVLTRAQALADMDRPEEAIRLLRDYEAIDRRTANVPAGLGVLLADEERWDEARAAAGRALAIASTTLGKDQSDASLWSYHFTRGAYAAEAGDWPAAEADLREALRLAPEEPVVLNYLGYSLVERGEQLPEAFAMIEAALNARPESGAITDSLGWAYYQQGDYERAVRLLEEAVALDPGSATITDHLGDAYWQTGRRNEARYEWRRALLMEDITGEERAAIEAKLAGRAPVPGVLDAAG